jgi:hypothetical protein
MEFAMAKVPNGKTLEFFSHNLRNLFDVIFRHAVGAIVLF